MDHAGDDVVVGDRNVAHQAGDFEGNVARLLRMILVGLRRSDHLGALIEREVRRAQLRLRTRQIAAGIGIDEALALGQRRGLLCRRARNRRGGERRIRHVRGEQRLRRLRLVLDRRLELVAEHRLNDGLVGCGLNRGLRLPVSAQA